MSNPISNNHPIQKISNVGGYLNQHWTLANWVSKLIIVVEHKNQILISWHGYEKNQIHGYDR